MIIYSLYWEYKDSFGEGDKKFEEYALYTAKENAIKAGEDLKQQYNSNCKDKHARFPCWLDSNGNYYVEPKFVHET